MSGRRIGIALTLAALLVAVAAGCGGSSDSSESTATGQTSSSGAATGSTQASESTAYVAPANAVCRRMLREAKQVGRGFVRKVTRDPEHDLIGDAPEGLFRPGVRVLGESAARMRAVEAKYPDPSFSVYVGLFEPLVQLGRLMLEEAEAGNAAESHNLQDQMEGIGAEQRTAARLAGLADCRVNFLKALVTAWSHP